MTDVRTETNYNPDTGLFSAEYYAPADAIILSGITLHTYPPHEAACAEITALLAIAPARHPADGESLSKFTVTGGQGTFSAIGMQISPWHGQP